MSAHTPGPWKKRKGFDPDTLEIFAPNPALKKPFYPTELAVVRSEDEEGKANARLIVAAPELPDLLQTMPHPEYRTGITHLTNEWREWDAKRRSAIAKATGGAS